MMCSLILVDFASTLKVTLVHGGERLVEFLGPKASTKALKWLQSKKVTVMLNDRFGTHFHLIITNYV
jgi:NADH dehydrogenase FAD-containing subunit